MGFWELTVFAGTMSAIFGIFITIFAIINGRSTRKILMGIKDILVRIEQGQTEARREAAEARREMAEAVKFLAQLIVSEAEKTRQEIRSQTGKSS